MTVFKNSRYAGVKARVVNGVAVLKQRTRLTFNERNARYYTFIQGDTLDGIAYRLYGKASLWWVIMDANRKYQSEVEIKAGDILVIPDYDEVVSKL